MLELVLAWSMVLVMVLSDVGAVAAGVGLVIGHRWRGSVLSPVVVRLFVLMLFVFVGWSCACVCCSCCWWSIGGPGCAHHCWSVGLCSVVLVVRWWLVVGGCRFWLLVLLIVFVFARGWCWALFWLLFLMWYWRSSCMVWAVLWVVGVGDNVSCWSSCWRCCW